MSKLENQKKLVEQLRIEAPLKREKLSVVCKELLSYIEDHKKEDPLVSGFSSQNDNPYKESGGCLVI